MRLLSAAVLVFLTACRWPEPDPDIWGMPERHSGRAQNARFAALVDAYLAWHYAAHPNAATYDGIHDYDGKLDDASREAIGAESLAQSVWLGRLRGIDRNALADDAYYDWLVLEAAIRARILSLDEMREWERYPSHYKSIISSGLYAMASLKFAAPEKRLQFAVERLSGVKAVLAAAKANLRNPAKIHTEMAIEEFAGTRAYIKDTLAAAFDKVGDDALRKRFVEAQAAAVAEIDGFIAWLKADLLPKSTGEVAIGEPLYRKKLELEEMVDTPIDELISQGEKLLRTTQAAFEAQAREIDPAKTPGQVYLDTASDHSTADKLLDDARAMMEGLKKFADEKLCAIPSDADCRIQETPSFRRSTSFASMEIPGPFEAVAKDAYYSITLPDPAWPPEKQEQHLKFFNRYALTLISVHEAYPGHYTQFLAVRTLPSKVRRVFGCGSFAEGWAHYLEQVYVDELDKPDPKLRLHQLHMALLRIGRYLVGLRMHCRGMTYEEAVEFFKKETWQEQVNAERESRRGTSDPTYLMYTLGKHQLLALRDEVKQAQGGDFNLREFHNRFISVGYPPIKIARLILLGRRS